MATEPARPWDRGQRLVSLLTFDQLHVFRTVAVVGSFREATTHLHISQPAISQKIQHLETILGTQLFERRRGVGVTLTTTGRMLLELVEDLSARLDHFGAQLELARLPFVDATLTVSAPSDEIQYSLLRILPELRLHHPNLRVVLRQAISRKDTIRMIREGEADVGICRSPAPDEVKTIATVQERLYLVGTRGHPLGALSPERRSSALREYSFATYAQGMRSRAVIDNWAQRNGVQLKIDLESRSIEVMKQAALHDVALTVLPRYAIVDELASGQLVTIDVPGLPLWRATAIVIAPDAEPSPAAAALVAGYLAALSTTDLVQ